MEYPETYKNTISKHQRSIRHHGNQFTKIQHAVPLKAGLPTQYAVPLRAGLPTQYITMQYDMARNANTRNTILHYGKRLEYTIIRIQLWQSY